jgi:HTH-type transcriptional regulator/antitoxin HigA
MPKLLNTTKTYKTKTMNWKVIKTETEYKNALQRAKQIFHAEPNTPEDEELELLLVLIKDYEDKNITMPEINALEVIKWKMQENGLKAKDLETIIGSKGHVSAILSGKREITLKMAQKLKEFFKIPAEVFLHSA